MSLGAATLHPPPQRVLNVWGWCAQFLPGVWGIHMKVFKLAQKSLCRQSQLPSSEAGLWLALLPEGYPRRAGGSVALCVLAQLLEALGHFL